MAESYIQESIQEKIKTTKKVFGTKTRTLTLEDTTNFIEEDTGEGKGEVAEVEENNTEKVVKESTSQVQDKKNHNNQSLSFHNCNFYF